MELVKDENFCPDTLYYEKLCLSLKINYFLVYIVCQYVDLSFYSVQCHISKPAFRTSLTLNRPHSLRSPAVDCRPACRA